MRYSTILRLLGLLLMIFSLTMVPPLLVELWYHSGTFSAFYLSFLTSFGVGFVTWFPLRSKAKDLRSRDGFLVVVLFWLSLCLVGALPFYWSPYPNITFTDAFFESVSGITTTGSTVLTGLDYLPHAILFYRQQLQFLGGIGIIILAVAVLPMLGVGGMQLFKAEFTGPVKDNKLTPRITETAKSIWLIYVIMAVLCAMGFWLGGMPPFDAVCYSFSTVSTGGFAPHDASMAHYHSPFLKLITIIFMFLGAVSFNLHYLAFKRKKVGIYSQDQELWLFIKIMVFAFAVVWGVLVYWDIHLQKDNLLIDVLFEVVSLSTTTGLTSIDFTVWPVFVPLLLLFCGVIGGCAGSTSGGFKVIRLLLLKKQGTREIRRLIHPRGQYVIKIGGKAVSPNVIEAIWGFLAFYIASFSLLLLLVLTSEGDFFTAYTALIATFSNIGPGLGDVSQNFSSLSDFTKWVLSFAMLVGRLEIFTVLVLFSPTFWRG